MVQMIATLIKLKTLLDLFVLHIEKLNIICFFLFVFFIFMTKCGSDQISHVHKSERKSCQAAQWSPFGSVR